MKHLKPRTPAAPAARARRRCRGRRRPRSRRRHDSGRPPPCVSRRGRRTVVVAGMLLSGMSTMVVTPPAAAARVAVAKPSHSVRPGSLTCTWVSTRPGMTTRSPTSSACISPAGRRASVDRHDAVRRGMTSVPAECRQGTRPVRCVETASDSGDEALRRLSCTYSPRPRERRFDQAVRLLGRDEDLVAVLEAERREVDGQVVPVRHDQADRADVVVGSSTAWPIA